MPTGTNAQKLKLFGKDLTTAAMMVPYRAFSAAMLCGAMLHILSCPASRSKPGAEAAIGGRGAERQNRLDRPVRGS